MTVSGQVILYQNDRLVAPVGAVKVCARLELPDGEVEPICAADGRYLRQLNAGQPYDGATITSIAWVLSTAPATYDLLPAGPTGAYWANGILVGSTLKR